MNSTTMTHAPRALHARAADWMRRRAAAMLLGLAAVSLAPVAHADRSFERRFPAPADQPLTVKGDIVLVGNHVVSCSNPGGDAACAAALAGGTARNNDFVMAHVNVDPDGGANFNSSIATLSLPSGSTVLFAGLYWNGRSFDAARNQVRWKRPGTTTFTALTADVIDQSDASTADYQAFKDVTADVQASGNGAYTVANVQALVGASDRWGSWTLVVAYQNAGGTLRNLSVFDGFTRGAGGTVDIAISGFFTPIAGVVNTNLGVVVYDGDRGQSDGGNSLEFGPNAANLSPVFNDLNPQTDVWNSTISVPAGSGTQAANVTAGRTPASLNLLGLDIDNLRPNVPLPLGSTTALLRYRSTANDVNFPGIVTLATDAFEPEIITSFTKTAVDTNGGGFRPGDTITYRIALTNQGNDNALNTRISDPLPTAVTFVPGSLRVVAGPNSGAKTDGAGDDQAEYDAASRTVRVRLGTGANTTVGGTIAPSASTTVEFDVVINPAVAAGTTVSNIATVNYTSGTSNQPGSGQTPPSSFTVQSEADVSVAKTGPATVTQGGTVTYAVTVANAGPDAADGTTVTDDVPDALGSIAITCAASGGATCPATAGLTDLSALAIPALPSGGAVVFTITGTAPASGSLSNTASAAVPASVVDPATGNNTSATVTTTVTAFVDADLAIVKTLLTPSPAAVGSTVTYRITLTNNGPGNVAGAQIADALPAQLTAISATCTTPAFCSTPTVSGNNVTATATLANGESAVIEVSGTAPATTANPIGANTATVTPPGNVVDPTPGNDSSTVPSIPLTAGVIDAVDDTGSAGTVAGGTAVANVLGNDTLGGAQATLSNVVLSFVSSTSAGVTLDAATGAVNVAPGTAPGTYTLTYRICEASAPANCDDAVVTVTVLPRPIAANADAGTVANGAAGGTALPNVLANDSLGGVTPTTADVAISQVGTTNPNVTVDASGAVRVAPGTPAGTYTVRYRICETAVPGNCAEANVVVTVGAAPIDAVDDSGTIASGAAGGTAITNVLGNDTLGGTAASLTTVELSQLSTSNPNVTLDPATGAVNVAAGTPAGTYSVTYRICERLNPTNCDDAVATVTVGPAPIDAVNDSGTVANGAAGGTAVANVLGNDTLDGASASLATVVLSQVSTTNPNVTLDAATGAVNVAAGTPAGTYSVTYRICERLNPTNCDDAVATVTVGAAPINAVDDGGTVANGAVGGTAVANVLGNDTLGGATASLATVVLTQLATSNQNVTLDPATGAVNVGPGTPAGSYTVAYRICERLNPANCDDAVATVTVGAAPIDAVNDSGTVANGAAGGAAVANVLGNDTLGGATPSLAAVVLAQLSTTNPNVTLDPATGAVNVAAGTPAGTYTVTYRICERLNPANCDDAIATVTVGAAPIDAVDDGGTVASGATGGTAVANVLGNDTLGGATPSLATVVLTQVSTTNPSVTLDPATGAVNVAPGTPAGSYTVTYRICERLNPANCDNAIVTVGVGADAINAVDDAGTVGGAAGGTAVANVLGNDTLGGTTATLARVTLSQTATSNPNVTLDPATGAVRVAPNTPAGTYVVNYRICDRLNPANCDDAVVSVTVLAAAIDAVDDAGTVSNGASGGTAVPDVLVNDTLGGVAVNPAAVVLSQVSTTNPNVTLDPATRAVNVAPGTPAGTYTLVYRICEVLNPANCDTASVVVTVLAPAIDAVDDAGTIASGATGGTAVPDVLANDTLGGVAVNPAAVMLSQASTTNPNVTLDPATRAVNVAPGTPAGTYTLVYRICEVLNPANCDTASVVVTVLAPAIDAVDDAGTIASGGTGGTAVPDVLANDTLGGVAVNPAAVVLSQVSTTSPNVTLDPATRAVSVAPGTPAGTYTLVYRICEVLNPANCDTASVVVTVLAPAIDAVDDAGTPVTGASGGVAVPNVLANDTLGGATPTLSTVALAFVSSTQPGVTLDASTGAVSVAAGTPAGTYALVYRICERLNPSNCDTATVTVTVTAARIVADDDTLGPVNGAAGGNAGNVIGNDTLDGRPIVLGAGGNATLTPVTRGPLTVNADGTVTVAPGTPAGTYTVTYTVCEVLNPSNCDTATVTVTVQPARIIAIDDTIGPVNGGRGGVVPGFSVVGNDTLNGAPITLGPGGNATIAPVTTGPLTVNADGTVTVAPNTPAGTYTVTYTVCEALNPSNCATATVTVIVSAPAITAADDTATVPQNTPVAIPVLRNDTVGGAPANPAGVTVTIVTAPANGTVRVNADGTVTFTPNANFSGGDTFTYRVCETLNPSNCAVATVSVTVPANVVDARDDTGTTPQSGPLVITVIGNDTSTGAPLDPASLIVVGNPANGRVVVGPNGTLTYTPNQFFNGTDTFTYRICDRSTPTPACDTATVTVTVSASAPQLRIAKQAATRSVQTGDLVRYTVVLENTGEVAIRNATMLDVPPAGFTFVDTSLRVDDGDDSGVIAGTSPLRVTGIDIAIGQRATVTYVLRVGAGVGRGMHTNRASALDVVGSAIGNVATADVEIAGDALLDTSLIVGSVFDDVDGNGVQGEGERGIPGVRIASVEGLVMETDGHGRYHLEGVDVGNSARGSNFILKVDAATLPPGTTFTTENPRVRRITPGLPVRFDFGVRLPPPPLPEAPTPPGAPAPAASDAGDR